MRILKLALATGFALLIASGSAYAITVKKRIEAGEFEGDLGL